MKNQVDVINGMSEETGVAHYLNSSLNKAAIQQVMDDVRNGITKLLYVAPESLNKEENVEFLKSVNITFVPIYYVIHLVFGGLIGMISSISAVKKYLQ